MSPDEEQRPEGFGPRVGLTLLLEGREWEVTGQSTYWNEAGYRVQEWCCEIEDTTAYLLKESDEKERRTKWFFAREIPAEAVALEGGEALGDRLRRNRGASPPSVATYQDLAYRYEDTTEGTHEEESGKRVRKITWDYWDARHAHNLAVELWPDGRFDCYHGAYIDPGQVQFRPARAGARWPGRLAANPFLAAGVFLPFAYLLPFLAGRPFDQCLAFALPLAALGGWAMAVARAPVAGTAALIAVPALAAVFWRYPPLTTAVGLVAVLGAPAIILWLARKQVSPGRRLAVLYTACFGVAAPLLVVGLYSYFRFAPGPHSPDQLALALGPAVLGGVAACLLSGLVTSGAEERGS